MQPRKVSSAARTSVLLTVRGGARRMVVPPIRLTRTFSFKQRSKNALARPGSPRSRPSRSPSPRTSAPGIRVARVSSAFLRMLPLEPHLLEEARIVDDAEYGPDRCHRERVAAEGRAVVAWSQGRVLFLGHHRAHGEAAAQALGAS